jgi:hypothetical protein
MPRVTPQGPEGTVWFGGPPDEASLRLRVVGENLDPDVVTRLLGREPSRSQRKGEPILSPAGEVRRTARTGSWLLDVPDDENATLSEAIEALLRSLPSDPSVWTSVTSGFTVDLVCDLALRCFNRGFELPPRLLGMLAERGIRLGFDIYCWVDPVEDRALPE